MKVWVRKELKSLEQLNNDQILKEHLLPRGFSLLITSFLI
jgi:hypothetical protein